jgi:hypothetical protein
MIIKIWPWNLLFGIFDWDANAGIKYQGPDQIYDIFFKLWQSCLIAVSPGYSVFQQVLKYLNSLKAIWSLNHLNLSGYNKE